MLRSMYSGISGMRANQVKLDVIGNNISNVSTTGFKVSRTRFQDMLSQNVSSALAPSLNQGGVNPSKVGLGVKVAGIDTVVSQGAMQPTSRSLDVAVDGSGYFMVAKGPVAFSEEEVAGDEDTAAVIASIQLNSDKGIGDSNGREVFYTRDGSFTLDADGNLLTSDGLRVLGYSIKSGDTESINPDGTLNYINADATDLNVGDYGDGTEVDDTGAPVAVEVFLKTLRIPDKIKDTDGKELRIINFSIEKDGMIKAVCEGGRVAALGQIAMASFKNPAGLDKQGQNLYLNSSNSGNAVVRTGIGTPDDQENSKGYGDMLQGMLEMSNVDLAEQFTEMIVTSRAFQASGKMITTGDEILQDIINLKR